MQWWMCPLHTVCALFLGAAGGCLVITDFDVEPAQPSAGGNGGGGEDGGNGGNGGSGGSTDACEIVFSDRILKHVDVEPGPTGRIYYSTELVDSGGGGGGGGGVAGEIRRVDKDCTGDEQLMALDSDVDFVKVSQTRVYFTSFGQGQVRSVLKTGAFPETYSMMIGPLAGLALAGPPLEVAFWHDFAVAAYPAFGGPSFAPQPLTNVSQDNGWGMAVDPTDYSQVYWTTWGTMDDTGTVAWRPTYDIVHVIASNQAKPSGIALDDTFVYWIDAPGAIWRHARGNKNAPSIPPAGLSEQIVPSQASWAGFGSLLVVDDTHVYWGGVGGLYRAEKDGGGAGYEQLFTADTVSDVAMDDEFVYGVTWDEGKLFKVPKR